MVVFVPSFRFLEELKQIMTTNGQLERIEKRKKIFHEPISSTNIDQLLRDYSIYLSQSEVHGALLFSVVGGKLSEGINFSDDLARCVVMIGLPYPNASSLELKEKLKYIESLRPHQSHIYYENLCMRSINQSIGRAIRHAKDYASILLIDQRYMQTSIRKRLPSWIQDKISTEPLAFGHLLRQLALFYKKLK
ncbi:ATP-dependent DNA helicase chl1 [Coelomomyces lativittatus]|nr:ATP-dependent DNA helicase chl1 [Coelomomyces lativittatus]KAJ1513518.1 ATP-dependent DNA helicase chl1 [Coelomomyces lativittatus]KAJ1517560.1 ATP-dependent DNA helicase chl1 [Coelomomyces lativittatus]